MYVSKAPGINGIHSRFLKELKCEIADLLTKICNLSLRSAFVPEDWKADNVTSVRKGIWSRIWEITGRLASVLRKLMERVIKDNMIKHGLRTKPEEPAWFSVTVSLITL